MNAFVPEVKFNKTGFEIRTDILEMAKEFVTAEYHSKFMGWEISNKKDEKTGQVVSTVAMPEFPGLEKLLEVAEKMNSFVTNKRD